MHCTCTKSKIGKGKNLNFSIHKRYRYYVNRTWEVDIFWTGKEVFLSTRFTRISIRSPSPKYLTGLSEEGSWQNIWEKSLSGISDKGPWQWQKFLTVTEVPHSDNISWPGQRSLTVTKVPYRLTVTRSLTGIPVSDKGPCKNIWPGPRTEFWKTTVKTSLTEVSNG